MVQVLSILSRCYSLALSNPLLPEWAPASLTLCSADWFPTYLPKDPASDCSYQRGGERGTPLLVSLVTTPSPLRLYMYIGSEDCHHVLPTSCHTQWEVTPGPCFGPVSSPHPVDHRCLCCCLCLFLWSWSWVSTGPAGLWSAAQQLEKKILL